MDTTEYPQAASPKWQDQQNGSASARIDRTDLQSIRGQLEAHVKRAHDIAGGVHSLADTIVGCRPEAASGGIAPQSIQPSLAELVEDLGRAINRAELGLNRF